VTGLGAPAGETCAACDAPLAEDQRFCLACGLRCAPDELRLAVLPLAVVPPTSTGRFVLLPRRPIVRSAAITAVVVLTMGVAIGAAIGPAAVGQTAAAQPSVVVVGAPAVVPDGADAEEEVEADALASDESSPAEEITDLPAESVPDEPPVAASVPPSNAEPVNDETPTDESEQATQDTPPPGSGPLAGFVVATAADRFTLVDREGALRELHASGCDLHVGDDLHLRAWQLTNGTWAADRIRRLPKPATRYVVVGTVTWVDPAGGRYALGARGTTLIVTAPAPAPPAPALPLVGERVRVALELPAAPETGVQSAPVVERRRTTLPIDPDSTTPPLPLELRGRVATVDPQVHTFALELDPDDPATTVTLAIPEGIEPAAILPAQDAAVTATPAADGYLLTGISNDSDAGAAGDASMIQGDQATAAAPRSDAAATTTTTCTLLEPRRPV